MACNILYHVTFAENNSKRKLHINPCESFVAVVNALEDNNTFRAYHLYNGKHYIPDYAAIRAAIPHYHRKAFDRAASWFYPLTMHSALSGLLDKLNSCNLTMRDSRGRLLGTIYATPYLA